MNTSAYVDRRQYQETQDKVSPSTLHLNLHLRGQPKTLEGKLKWLLEDITQASVALDSPDREELQNFLKGWEEKFFTHYKSFATDEEKMEFISNLAELYFKAAQNSNTKKFCGLLKPFFIDLAPQNCNMDTFLHNYPLRMLLQEMKESAHTLPKPLDEGMLKLFQVWEFQFFQQFNGNIPSEQKKIQAAKRLCTLYCKVESLVLYMIQDPQTQVLWFDIYNKLKESLKEILPDRFSVEEFLLEYRQRNKILEIKRLFQCIQNRLYFHANEINEELMNGFKGIQEEMIKVQDAKELSTQQIYEQVDALTKSVTQLFVEFGGHMKEMKEIADLLQQQGNALGATLNEANRVLNKV